MIINHINFSNPTSLEGARIWLSGSIPENETITNIQRGALIEFVRMFARRVFSSGGYIVHGSHPSFTPILIEEAKLYKEKSGRRDCLILVVSRYWSKDPEVIPLNQWRKVAIVNETPEVTGLEARNESLKLLRKFLVSRCDAIVAVGGKWWQSVNGKAGIPLELELSIERGIPCFLLGGLGGVAQEFVNQHPEIFTRLKNGLDQELNRKIAINENIGSLADQVCKQLERLPLVHGRGSDGASFRILALDGGGLKGAFTASALATWEEHTGLRIIDHFDLIAGTSTGGILAVGLGLGLTGKEMLEFYKARGPKIFPVTHFHRSLLHSMRHIFSPKYSQKILLSELESGLYKNGNHKLLKDSLCRLVIPSYHALAGASHVFRTPHHPDLTSDSDTQAAHVALATAAAPTYFTAARIANMITESSYFDGGVWANSPVMAAIIESVCYLRIPLERIDVLSVGTTKEPFSFQNQIRSGAIGWVWKKRILELLMHVQQESSLKLAHCLVGEPRFLRVNTVTVPGSFALDKPKEIKKLVELGNLCANDPTLLRQIKSRFLNGVCVSRWESYE